jgi:CheY-like chemotaxis protein
MADKAILLIEDNPDDADLTVRAFKKNNILNEFIVHHDGIQALDYLMGTGAYTDRDITQLPVLILLDLNLPKLNGLEVLERIRAAEHTKYLPVVILTSSKEEKDVVIAYHRGCNSYVRKPVDFGEFMEAARQLGVYWLALNIAP